MASNVEKCCICLVEFEFGQLARVNSQDGKCTHRFCVPCISAVIDGGIVRCPLCRRRMERVLNGDGEEIITILPPTPPPSPSEVVEIDDTPPPTPPAPMPLNDDDLTRTGFWVTLVRRSRPESAMTAAALMSQLNAIGDDTVSTEITINEIESPPQRVFWVTRARYVEEEVSMTVDEIMHREEYVRSNAVSIRITIKYE